MKDRWAEFGSPIEMVDRAGNWDTEGAEVGHRMVLHWHT